MEKDTTLRLDKKVKMKTKDITFIDHSTYMELIDELATQLTELNFHEDTWEDLGNGQQFTKDAFDFYNERYDEVERLFNTLGNIYSKTQ